MKYLLLIAIIWGCKSEPRRDIYMEAKKHKAEGDKKIRENMKHVFIEDRQIIYLDTPIVYYNEYTKEYILNIAFRQHHSEYLKEHTGAIFFTSFIHENKPDYKGSMWDEHKEVAIISKDSNSLKKQYWNYRSEKLLKIIRDRQSAERTDSINRLKNDFKPVK